MSGDIADIPCQLCDTCIANVIGLDDDDNIDIALCAHCFRRLLGITDEFVTLLAAGLIPTKAELAKLRAAENN